MNELVVENVTWVDLRRPRRHGEPGARLGRSGGLAGRTQDRPSPLALDAVARHVLARAVRARWVPAAAHLRHLGPSWRSAAAGAPSPTCSPSSASPAAQTFTVQLQDPRIGPKHFDLVVPPDTTASRAQTSKRSSAAPTQSRATSSTPPRTQWRAQFERSKHPRIAVLDRRQIEIAPLRRRRRADARRSVEGPRRTRLRPDGHNFAPHGRGANGTSSENALAGTQAFVWDGTGDNPYFGMLGPRRCHSRDIGFDEHGRRGGERPGKPVYIVDLPGGDPKFDPPARRPRTTRNRPQIHRRNRAMDVRAAQRNGADCRPHPQENWPRTAVNAP